MIPVHHPLRRNAGLRTAPLRRRPRRVARRPRPGAPELLGRGARRRVDDDARRGDGPRGAQHSRTRARCRPRRGHGRDEDQLHAARPRGTCAPRPSCCTAAPRWPSARPRCSTTTAICAPMPPAPSSTCANCRPRAAPSRRSAVRPQRPRNRSHDDTRQPPMAAGLAPAGRAHARQLPSRRDAAARAGGRPGAGAPPLPEPGPVHARPHERRQELRRRASRSTR